MKLSDELIAHIAQTLQIAILTGTDVVDNMRLIKVKLENEEVVLDEKYKESHEGNIEKMLERATANGY